MTCYYFKSFPSQSFLLKIFNPKKEVYNEHLHTLHLDSSRLHTHWDFPGGPVVKNPPSNAGYVGSIPGQGTKIPYAAGQLSPRATPRESVRRNYWAHVLWSPHATPREVRAPQRRAHTPQQRPSAARKKNKKITYTLSNFHWTIWR